ncbi:MAG TPA: M3 family oligoendopeptidase, partial [Candidatus Eisenbacteria bacterium]|nr:M3 family oligoendopeptidase [Candidatus Eisenbacteria bacterium]
MKKFQDLKYQRPNMEKLTEEIVKLQNIFDKAENSDQQFLCFQRMDTIQNYFSTMYSIANIRHSIDTRDEFYDQEINFYNENLPLLEKLFDTFYRALLISPFRNELEKKYGRYLFDLLETKAKTFSTEIMEDLVEENKLITEYSKLIAAAEVEFQGEKYTLAQLTPLRQSKNR